MLEAIGGEITSQKLNDNFSYLDSNMSDIAVSINSFPIIIPEANDTARFQRAVDSGYNIRLLGGRIYTVNNVLIKRDGFTLFLNGSKLVTSDPTASCLLIDPTSKNIKIKKGDFQGLADGTNANPAGINILPSGVGASRGTSAQNIEISRCNFLGGFVFSIIATGTTGLKIHDCYGTGNKYVASASAGGYFILTQTCYDVDIYNNKAVATATDRHAVYISCNNSLTGSKINENVNIHHNNFDWSLANGGTQQEAVMVIRSTIGGHIHDNKTKGGWGGIKVNPSHGDCVNIDIHDNQVLDVLNTALNENCCIGSVLQDKGGSYSVRNLKLHDNTVTTLGDRVHGFTVIDTIGFELENNTIFVSGSGSYGTEIYHSSNGIIDGNRMNGNGTARSGIEYLDVNDDISVGINKLLGFTKKEEVYSGSSLTNPYHSYNRTARITSDGLGGITVSNDLDNIISSVATEPNGCIITFNKTVKVRNGFLSVIQVDASFNRFFSNRTADSVNNTLSLGIKKYDVTATYPLNVNAMSFDISISE